MAKRSAVDLSSYQVIVDKPIWLCGRIWDPNVYENPPAVLTKCAEECHTDNDAIIHFGINGERVNPFARATMVELNGSDEGDGEGEVSTGVDEDGDGVPDGINDTDFEFATASTFAAMSKSEQLEYVESIRNAPEGYSDALTEKYEADLFAVMTEYLKVASSSKAKTVIENTLAEYEEN